MNLVTMTFGRTAVPPKDYVCVCGAENVKLWRPIRAELTSKKLYCLKCLLPLLGLGRNQIDSSGRERKTNQDAPTLRLVNRSQGNNGDAVPAIPNKIRKEDGEIYLFTEFRRIPHPALRWWQSLPLSN